MTRELSWVGSHLRSDPTVHRSTSSDLTRVNVSYPKTRPGDVIPEHSSSTEEALVNTLLLMRGTPCEGRQEERNDSCGAWVAVGVSVSDRDNSYDLDR